jgi:glutamyl-tRNA reductase
VAEIERIHSRLSSLTAEQLAAVEALTRGLVYKFLLPPMQALKQAAGEGYTAGLDALCDEWSVPPSAPSEVRRESEAKNAGSDSPSAESGEGKNVVDISAFKGGAEARR